MVSLLLIAADLAKNQLIPSRHQNKVLLKAARPQRFIKEVLINEDFCSLARPGTFFKAQEY